MWLLQWGLSSLGFCWISSNNFFVFKYTYLPLVLTIDFCNSQLILFLYISYFKKIQRQKTIKYSENNEFIKERWGVPLLNFEEGPGILFLNFEGGPGVPLLNFRVVSGPGSRCPGPTFTPCQYGRQIDTFKSVSSKCCTHHFFLYWNCREVL